MKRILPTIIFGTILLIGSDSHNLYSQIDYRDNSVLNRLIININDDDAWNQLETSIQFKDEKKGEKTAFSLLENFIEEIQKDNKDRIDSLSMQILGLSIQGECLQEESKRSKLECGEFIKSLKKLIAKYQMIKNLEIENRERYCDYLELYDKSIPAEFGRFRSNLIGHGCGGIVGGIDIYYGIIEYTMIIENVIRYDCSSDKAEMGTVLFSDLIGNSTGDRVKDPRIIDLLSNRLKEHIREMGCNSRLETDRAIQEFKNEARLLKGVWYSYTTEVCGLRVRFESSFEPKEEWTKKEKRKMERGKIFKTKRQIIKEFKQTVFYEVLSEK